MFCMDLYGLASVGIYPHAFALICIDLHEFALICIGVYGFALIRIGLSCPLAFPTPHLLSQPIVSPPRLYSNTSLLSYSPGSRPTDSEHCKTYIKPCTEKVYVCAQRRYLLKGECDGTICVSSFYFVFPTHTDKNIPPNRHSSRSRL